MVFLPVIYRRTDAEISDKLRFSAGGIA